MCFDAFVWAVLVRWPICAHSGSVA